MEVGKVPTIIVTYFVYRKECHSAENVQLPNNMHSAWGVGKTMPDPAQNKTLDDGTVVPLGKPVTNNVNTSLLYNEYPLLITITICIFMTCLSRQKRQVSPRNLKFSYVFLQLPPKYDLRHIMVIIIISTQNHPLMGISNKGTDSNLQQSSLLRELRFLSTN